MGCRRNILLGLLMQLFCVSTALQHISQSKCTLNSTGLVQHTMVAAYSSKNVATICFSLDKQLEGWRQKRPRVVFPPAQIKLALPVNLQTLDRDFTTGYRHGTVFKQCQPIKAIRRAIQLISLQFHSSLKLAGPKPQSGSNLWKTVRPPKNVAMVKETERDRRRRKGQTNTLYIPRAREGNLPRC